MDGAAALVLWLGLTAAPPVELGEALEPGLYGAQVLLHACSLADGRPNVYSDPACDAMPVSVLARLPLTMKSYDSMLIALRAAGVFRVPYLDADGAPYAYVTIDPAVPPEMNRRFQVRIVPIAEIDPETAVKVLSDMAARLEADIPEDEVPSLFLVAPGRGSRLVIRCSSEERLTKYLETLRDLDRPAPPEKHLVLRVWKPRHRPQAELGAELERVWRNRFPEQPPELHIVESDTTGDLLLRLEAGTWEDVRALLEQLDQPAKKRGG